MADQIYSLVMSYNSSGQFAQNITHWRFDDAGYNSTHDAASALITAFEGSRKALLMGCLPNVVTLLSLKARRVTSSGGFEAVSVQTAGNVGTRVGGQTVTGISPCVVGYPANQSGRKRARFFLPGIKDTDIVNGVFIASYKVAIAGAFATLFDPLTLAGGGGPVASYVIKFSSPALATIVSTWLLSDACGQIRRRQVPA